MRVSRSTTIFVLALFLALAVAAQADTVQMKLVGVGGAHQNGVYVAPYYLTVDGGPKIGMMCDDFLHDNKIGDTWTAAVGTISDLSGARFFATAGVTGYQEAFWLYDQYKLHPADAGNINFAVWAIFDPSIIGNPTYWNTAEAAWLQAAQTADLSHYDFSAFLVYTPVNPTSTQEMITKTPEPASMVLLGSGLITIAGLIRRRKKV